MIELPFMPEFKDRMLSGRKTATTRTRKFGEAGEHFAAFGVEFVFTSVVRVYLQDVVSTSYKVEGFNSQPEFIECWKKIHPWKGYLPEQKVWYHQFKLAGRDR